MKSSNQIIYLTSLTRILALTHSWRAVKVNCNPLNIHRPGELQSSVQMLTRVLLSVSAAVISCTNAAAAVEMRRVLQTSEEKNAAARVGHKTELIWMSLKSGWRQVKPHCNTEVLNRNCASCEVRGGVCCYFSQYLTVSASNLVCVLFFLPNI